MCRMFNCTVETPENLKAKCKLSRQVVYCGCFMQHTLKVCRAADAIIFGLDKQLMLVPVSHVCTGSFDKLGCIV